MITFPSTPTCLVHISGSNRSLSVMDVHLGTFFAGAISGRESLLTVSPTAELCVFQIGRCGLLFLPLGTLSVTLKVHPLALADILLRPRSFLHNIAAPRRSKTGLGISCSCSSREQGSICATHLGPPSPHSRSSRRHRGNLRVAR